MDLELLKNHTHAGTKYPAGAIITVPDGKVAYMVAMGIGKKVKPAPPTRQDSKTLNANLELPLGEDNGLATDE